MSTARAIAKSLVSAATGGNLRATIALLTFCTKQIGDGEEARVGQAGADDAEILDDFVNREIRRRTAAATSEKSNPETIEIRNPNNETGN